MIAPRPRALRTLVLAALTALTLPALASTALATTAAAGPAALAPAVPACADTWRSTQVATGFGGLENLAFDGRGSMLLSESNALIPQQSKLWRLAPDGTRSPLRDKVYAPGAIVLDGTSVVHTIGNALPSGVTGKADGGLDRVDLTSGAVTPVARGLVMPNGLAALGDGRYVVSRDIGLWTGLTLVTPTGSQRLGLVGSANGLAYDPATSTLYVTSAFASLTEVVAVRVGDTLSVVNRWAYPGLGLANIADDLTIGPDGDLYVAHNLGGRIVRVDPDTGAQCVVASGLPMPSSVRFGSGPGWDPGSAYVTTLTGKVLRLTRA